MTPQISTTRYSWVNGGGIMKKHFMCTHAFFDDDAKQAFEDASIGMTDRQTFEMMKGEKAEMLGHWRGNDDFFFCHWYAEDEDAIIDHLDKVGFNTLMNTLPNEMPIYMAHDKITDKTAEEMAKKINPMRTFLIALMMTLATQAGSCAHEERLRG
jgi:hypothetical protein